MPILGGIGNISEYAYRGNAAFDPCPYDFVDLLNQEPNSTYYSLGKILPEDITAPTIIAPTGAGNYGESVATGQGKLVIGAPNTNNVGRVYVYNLDGTNEIIINPPTTEPGQRFGTSVAIGDDLIIVGASAKDIGTLTDVGTVYVYNLNGTLLNTIVPPEFIPGTTTSARTLFSGFGFSVAVGENRIVVGQPNFRIASNSIGIAWVFDTSGVLLSQLIIRGTVYGLSGDLIRCGESVSVGSGRIVVGSPGGTIDESNKYRRGMGLVALYDIDGVPIKTIKASDGRPQDFYGGSVSVGNGKIVIGSRDNNVLGRAGCGAVYIYDIDGNNEYKIQNPDLTTTSFGESVSVGGNKIVIGRPSGEGNAYIYDLNGNQLGRFNRTLPVNIFASSVAVSDEKILIGAFGSTDGSAYTYETKEFTTYNFQVIKCLTSPVPISITEGVYRHYFSTGPQPLKLSLEVTDRNLKNSLVGAGYTVEYSTFAGVFANDNPNSANFSNSSGTLPFFHFATDLPIADRFTAERGLIKPDSTYLVRTTIPEADDFPASFKFDSTVELFDSNLITVDSGFGNKVLPPGLGRGNGVYLTDNRFLTTPITGTATTDRPIIWGYGFKSSLSVGSSTSDWDISLRWPKVIPHQVSLQPDNVTNQQIYYYSDPARGIDEANARVDTSEIVITGLEPGYNIFGPKSNRYGARNNVSIPAAGVFAFEFYGKLIVDGVELAPNEYGNDFSGPSPTWRNGSRVSLAATNRDFVSKQWTPTFLPPTFPTSLNPVGYGSDLVLYLENTSDDIYDWVSSSPAAFDPTVGLNVVSLWNIRTENINLGATFTFLDDLNPSIKTDFTDITDAAVSTAFITGQGDPAVTNESFRVGNLNVGLQTEANFTFSVGTSDYRVRRNGATVSDFGSATKEPIRNDDIIDIETTTSAANSTDHPAEITIGTTSADWVVRTVAAGGDGGGGDEGGGGGDGPAAPTLSYPLAVSLLIVGGGGGGGGGRGNPPGPGGTPPGDLGNGGGGGGAGGVNFGSLSIPSTGGNRSWDLRIGQGGSGGTGSTQGQDGEPTGFSQLGPSGVTGFTAAGGGGGGAGAGNPNASRRPGNPGSFGEGGSGGGSSGGGGGCAGTDIGGGPPGFSGGGGSAGTGPGGSPGGSGALNSEASAKGCGGGGGGAAFPPGGGNANPGGIANGVLPSPSGGGIGGQGFSGLDFFETNATIRNQVFPGTAGFAGGGGGGDMTGNVPTGTAGQNGGGRGCRRGGAATNGTNGTGGGGGGGGGRGRGTDAPGQRPGGNGGSGVIVVKYPCPDNSLTAISITNVDGDPVSVTTLYDPGDFDPVTGEPVPGTQFKYHVFNDTGANIDYIITFLDG